MKICNKCKINKEETEFHKTKNYCKECSKIYCLEYRIKNKEKIKQYYILNKEKILERQKIYNKENRKERKAYEERYRSVKENYDRYRLSIENWRKNNKKYHKKSRKEYMKIFRKSSLNQRLRENISHRIRFSLINKDKIKDDLTEKYLGCSIKFYIKYLESLFTSEMTWGNYGKGKYWEIDHIIPISKFDFSKEEEIYKAFNYKNTQPLTIFENRSKNNNIIR